MIDGLRFGQAGRLRAAALCWAGDCHFQNLRETRCSPGYKARSTVAHSIKVERGSHPRKILYGRRQEEFKVCLYPSRRVSLTVAYRWHAEQRAVYLCTASSHHVCDQPLFHNCRAEPVQQWSLDLVPGKEVECLIDRLKARGSAGASHHAT